MVFLSLGLAHLAFGPVFALSSRDIASFDFWGHVSCFGSLGWCSFPFLLTPPARLGLGGLSIWLGLLLGLAYFFDFVCRLRGVLPIGMGCPCLVLGVALVLFWFGLPLGLA